MKKSKSFSHRLSRRVTIVVAIVFVAELFVVGLTSNSIIADESPLENIN